MIKQIGNKWLAAPLALLVLVGAAGGWYGYHRYTREPLASARTLMSSGDLRGALLELRNVVRNHPENAEAHFRLGVVQLAFGDAVAAERELKAARSAGWPEAQVLPPLSRAYLAQNRHAELLREFPATGLPPTPMAAVLVSRAMAQIALGDGGAALASASAAERLAPTMAEAALAGARVAQSLGDRTQALQKVDEALHLDPKQVEALLLKADLLRAQGDNAQALEQLDKAVAVLPEAERVRLARARALLAAGEDAKAREDVKVALKYDPRGTLANFLLAVLDIRARDWKTASASLEHVQPVLSQLPRGEYYYALVKSNTGELEQAAQFADHYVARVPTDPDGQRLVADIDIKLAEHAAADRAEQLKRAAGMALRKVTDLGANAAAARAAEPQLKSDATSDAQGDTPEGLTRLAALQLGAGDSAAASHDLDQSLESVPKRLDTGATQVIAALSAGDIARAEAALDRLRRQQDADPAMVGNLTGLVRMARLDFDGARQAWRDAANAAPDSAALHINLARVLALQSQGAEAEKLLDDVLARDPANRQALLALIDLRLAQGRLKDAIASVQTARKAAPALTFLLVTEAALRARSGDFSGAYGVLDEVPLEEAHTPALLTARGQIMLAQGRAKEAVDVFRQVLLANQGDTATRQRLIRLLVGLDQLPQALKLTQDGLARQPGNSALLRAEAALILRMPPPDGGLDKALAMADAAAREPINLPAARLLKGELYMSSGRYADAADAFGAEMKDTPFSALLVAEAGALRAAGRTDEAIAKLRDWVAKQPDPTVAQALAVNDIEAHQYDEARTCLESVLAARPSDPVALNNLAWVYQRQNDARARELAEKAYLLSPSPQASDTLGWIITQQGGADAAKGLLLLRRAAALLPRDPAVQYHFAAALQANGMRGEAVTVLGALLATPAKFDERPQAVALQQKLGAK